MSEQEVSKVRPVFDSRKIRIICIEKGLTQVEFANKNGYAVSYINAIIRNRRVNKYKIEIADAFAAYLGVALTEIAEFPYA
jgi:transcriptional regulator with XRE-family HTH domain